MTMNEALSAVNAIAVAAIADTEPVKKTKVKTPAPVPPLNAWILSSTLALIESAPTNPVIRGKIRNELNIIPPKDMELTGDGWAKFLRENYHLTTHAKSVVAPQTGMRFDGDGNLIIPAVTAAIIERGTATFEHSVTGRGALVVPSTVVARGYNEVVVWIEANAARVLDITPSDVFEYTGLATQTRTASIAATQGIAFSVLENLIDERNEE